MKLKKMKSVLLGGALAALTASAAMAEAEIKLVFGVAGQPTWSFGKLLNEVIEPNLEKYSDGRIDLEVHQRGSLCSEAACIEQMGLGQIDMTSVSTGNIGAFGTTFDILNLPYLFKSQQDGDRILREWLSDELMKRAADEMDMHVLATVAFGGFRNVVNTEREVRVPDDLKGLKIRVTKSPTEFNLVKGWGAVPIPYAWASLYEGLQSGVVQGMYLQDVFVSAAKFYEVTSHVTQVEGSFSGRPILMRKDRYDGLPDWAKDAIDKVAKDIQRESFAYDQAWQKEAVAAMGDKIAIYVPNDEEMALWSAGAIDAWVKVKGTYDPALARRILEDQGQNDLIGLLEDAGAL